MHRTARSHVQPVSRRPEQGQPSHVRAVSESVRPPALMPHARAHQPNRADASCLTIQKGTLAWSRLQVSPSDV